jgi:hypothetical protein
MIGGSVGAARLRKTKQLLARDDWERADGSLGTAQIGGAWKDNTTNHVIAAGQFQRSGGTGRMFSLLSNADAGDLIIEGTFKTGSTANTTDGGVAFKSLDSTSTRGGQLYISFRQISGQNTIRLLNRIDTSGTDTTLVTQATGGWTNNTTYEMQIKVTAATRTVEVLRRVPGDTAYTSVLGPFAVTSTIWATLGNDVGLTTNAANADASRWENFQVYTPAGHGYGHVTTSMYYIVHRGIAASEQEASYVVSGGAGEESILGLQTLMRNHPGINGVEVDAYLTTDGIPFLAHDATGDRVHGFSARYDSQTSAQLDGYGVCRLSDYLVACNFYNFDEILVQHETSNTNANLGKIVDVIMASPVASRVTIMTSASAGATPGMANIRNASGTYGGWTGKIGCYGITATNWPTYQSDLTTYNVYLCFIPPNDSVYATNRPHLATMQAAGFQTGGSTIDFIYNMDKVRGDGSHALLTNEPGRFESIYKSPDNL